MCGVANKHMILVSFVVILFLSYDRLSVGKSQQMSNYREGLLKQRVHPDIVHHTIVNSGYYSSAVINLRS